MIFPEVVLWALAGLSALGVVMGPKDARETPTNPSAYRSVQLTVFTMAMIAAAQLHWGA